jgi:hypothetical protein
MPWWESCTSACTCEQVGKGVDGLKRKKTFNFEGKQHAPQDDEWVGVVGWEEAGWVLSHPIRTSTPSHHAARP